MDKAEKETDTACQKFVNVVSIKSNRSSAAAVPLVFSPYSTDMK